MIFGEEHNATLRDVATSALAPGAFAPNARSVVSEGLQHLSNEIYVLGQFLRYENAHSDEEGPVNFEIIRDLINGLSERARALSALVQTRMDVRWSEGEERPADGEGGAP